MSRAVCCAVFFCQITETRDWPDMSVAKVGAGPRGVAVKWMGILGSMGFCQSVRFGVNAD